MQLEPLKNMSILDAAIFLDIFRPFDYNEHSTKANTSSGCRTDPAESELCGSDP